MPTKINECDETTWVAGSVPSTDGSRAEDASGIKVDMQDEWRDVVGKLIKFLTSSDLFS